MTRNPLRPPTASLTVTGLLAAGLFVWTAASAPALGQVKVPGGGYGNINGGGNKGMKEEKEKEKKPDPVVIRLQSAQKGKHLGQEVMLVTGVEVLSGRQRTFAVENEPPQDKNRLPKYEPKARAKDGIEKVKPGEYLKVEPKAGRDQIPWIDKADPYLAKEHEEDPGTFVLYDAYKETKNGTDVFVITLLKFGAYVDCYASMVKDGKNSVPDPEVVRVAEEIMKRSSDSKKKEKELVEATVSQDRGATFVTSIDAYQAPKQGKFVKLAEADVDGNKGQAVELEHEGKTLTLPIPGKMVGKKWTTDPEVLVDAKRLKPGAAVVFKTRDVGEKSQLRMIAPAPKESAKKETAKVDPGPMLRSKEGTKK